MARVAVILTALICTPIVLAQQPTSPDKSLAFEVASVKPNEKTGSYSYRNLALFFRLLKSSKEGGGCELNT